MLNYIALKNYGVVAFTLLLASCGSVRQLTIPPQQTVILSNEAQEVYDIKVINQGTTAVRILEGLEHGEAIDQGFLSGREKTHFSFLSGSSALFSNGLSDTVYLKLRVFSTSELESRQEPIQ